jgi:hypothetical protein
MLDSQKSQNSLLELEGLESELINIAGKLSMDNPFSQKRS